MVKYIDFKRIKKGRKQPYLLRVSRHVVRLKRVVKGRHWNKNGGIWKQRQAFYISYLVNRDSYFFKNNTL